MTSLQMIYGLALRPPIKNPVYNESPTCKPKAEPTSSGSVWSSKHHGNFDRSRRHVETLRGRVDYLVNGLHGEVKRHKLTDWFQTSLKINHRLDCELCSLTSL